MSNAPLIVIDARTVRPGMTGVGRRTAHLVRALVRSESGRHWALLTADRAFLEQWLAPPMPQVELWDAPPRERHLASEWWMAMHLPRLLRESGAALFDGPAFELPRRRLRIPTVVTIHDLAHRLRPPTQPWRFRRWLDAAIAHSARMATRIVVPSQAVEQELVALHSGVRDRARVIPGGVAPEWRPLSEDERGEVCRREGLASGFLIHVGAFEPRKNHRFLLEVHTALCAETDDAPELVMIGEGGPLLPQVERWAAQSPFARRVRVLHSVDDARLCALVASAGALLFPSRAEGFGLPVLEAAACGTPVIASDVPGHRHFANHAARLLPLGDVRPWVEETLRLLTPAARSEWSGPARALAAHFTWDQIAAQVLHLYRELL